MRKKLLATVLAASMVLSLAPVLPVNTGTVASAEDAADAVETLTGTVWWTGNQVGKNYTLTGEGTLDLYIGYTAETAEGPAFSVELVSDTNKYITTGSDINIWTAEGATGTVEGGVQGGVITLGHQYKVSITRTGNDFSIVYYDLTDDKEHCTLTAKDTNMGDEVSVHVMAQVGTYMVSTAAFEMPDVTPGDTTPDDTTPDDTTPSETTGANFAAIETQPVVKYTFDNADGLDFAGEANVADGVLNLATSATNNVTYAQLPDLTSYDFSNGVTLTADINPTEGGDWTSIFMLGDGSIGAEGTDATALYHFTQGMSSVGGLNGNYFEGYFGNGCSLPGSWEYFAKEENLNKWHTVAVTITKDAMITYYNGKKIQEASGDFTNVLQAFKVAKNNYLGVSYWPGDHDFVGSMDNVGIYNTALSADDMAKLANAQSSDDETPSTPSTPAVKKKTMKLSKVAVKKNATKITGTVSVKKATVKIKVGKKAYKKATVKAKKFTLKVAKLKKGTKVTIKVTKSGYKTLTKNYTVK